MSVGKSVTKRFSKLFTFERKEKDRPKSEQPPHSSADNAAAGLPTWVSTGAAAPRSQNQRSEDVRRHSNRISRLYPHSPIADYPPVIPDTIRTIPTSNEYYIPRSDRASVPRARRPNNDPSHRADSHLGCQNEELEFQAKLHFINPADHNETCEGLLNSERNACLIMDLRAAFAFLKESSIIRADRPWQIMVDYDRHTVPRKAARDSVRTRQTSRD